MRLLISLAFAGLAAFASSAAEAQPVRVFVMAGQSNMVGDGDALPAELASQADVLYDFFNPDSREGGDDAGTASARWAPLAPKGVGPWYGPEITFAAQMKAALPSERVAISTRFTPPIEPSSALSCFSAWAFARFVISGSRAAFSIAASASLRARLELLVAPREDARVAPIDVRVVRVEARREDLRRR